MIEVQMFIPVADNNGQVFDAARFETFEHYASPIFNGLTLLGDLASGLWVSEGITYRDTNRVYLFGVDGLIVGAAKIIDVVEFAKRHFDQKMIYVRYLGVSEIL